MGKKYTLKYPEKTPNKKRKLTFRQYGSDWFPCRNSAQFKENYDQIKWKGRD